MKNDIQKCTYCKEDFIQSKTGHNLCSLKCKYSYQKHLRTLKSNKLKENLKSIKVKSLESEKWKPVLGFERYYEISSLGRVKSLYREFYTGHVLKIYPEKLMVNKEYKTGYAYIDLCANAVVTRFKIHRLVASHFIKNPKNLPCVDHLNAQRNDNRSDNLRWVTADENMNNPITKRNSGMSKMGKRNPSKKTAKQVLQISPEAGTPVKIWDSILEIHDNLGFDKSSLSRAATGVYKQYKGFIWIYL